MEYVKSFRDLEVYKLTREVSKKVFVLSRKFPREEQYSLTDQMRRSSRSVGAQIAEAWGKRRYELHFISKLTDADGEQLETQHWLEVAEEACGAAGDSDDPAHQAEAPGLAPVPVPQLKVVTRL